MNDKKMKILMVENVKHDYLLMERALQRSNLDFEITRVLRGKDAFEYLHSGKFNLVILDYKLPRETGLEIFHQMKEQGIDIPVVFVSGSGNEVVAAEAIRLGAQEYIVKDTRCGYLEILADALKKALRQWEIEQSRKKAKRKLEESEAKLRSFIESSTIGIWCFGGKPPVDIKLPEEELIKEFSRAICIECNEMYAKMMGTTKDKIIGMKLSEVMPDTKENREYFRAFIRNGYKLSGGISHEINKKGEVRYFSNSFVGTIREGKLIEAWGTQTDITEQKKVEDKLRFLSSITQQVTDCIIVTDLNFKITYINKTAEKMYGYSQKELFGKSPEILNAETRVKQIQKDIYKTVSSGKVWTGAHLNKRKDGSTFICEFKISPLFDERGKPAAYIAVQRDITERIQAEKAVQESKERYLDLYDNAPDMYFTIRTDGTIISVNRVGAEMLGYKKEELIGKPVTKVIHPDDIALVQKQLNKILKKKKGYISILKFRKLRKDGSVMYVSERVSFQTPSKGEPTLRIICRDITKLVEMDKKLHERRLYLERIMEHLPDAVVTLDVEGRVMEWNPEAEKLFGYTSEETVGKNIDDLVALPDPDTYRDATNFTKQTLAGKQISLLEAIRYRKDSSPVNVAIASSSIRVGNKVVGIVAAYRDITERKRLEREAEERRLYLENVLHSAPDAVITADNKQMILEWNPGAERLFGYTSDEVAGKNIDDLITGHNSNALKEAAYLTQQVLVDKRDVPPTETIRYRKDGTPVDVIVSGSPIVVEGKLFGVVATYIDLTEHKREDKIRESIYRIAEAIITTKDINELFGIIHDTVKRLMPAENAYITLYNSDTGFISFPYFVDKYDQTPEPKKIGKGLTEYVLQTKKPLLAVPKVISILQKEDKIEIIGTLPVSWLGVPLIIDDDVIGVVAVQSYTKGVKYTEKDKEILQYVSSQIAQAISSKQSEEKVYEQMSELQTFHRVTLGRENRIIELKHEVNKLLEHLGEDRKYKV